MAFVVTKTFGRSDTRFLQVDDWKGTPPVWLIDRDYATEFSNVSEAQNASLRHSGDSVLEVYSR